MSKLPYPISDDWEQAKYQIQDLLRILFEERIGGLKESSTLIRSKDVLTLFSGAADLHLLMSASGNDPEWANPYYLGTFTRNGSADTGDATVTGVPFKPKMVIISGGYTSAAAATIGFSDATKNYCLYNNHYAVASAWALNTAYCLYLYEDTGKGMGGIVKSMNSDGFTMNYTKVGGSTVTASFIYMAFR